MRYLPMRIMIATAAILFSVAVPMGMQALAQQAPASAAPLSEASVRALQEALAKQGIAVPASGVLDAETRAAIRTYQSQHHLPVTGEADKATLDKLGVSSGSSAIPSAPAGAATAPAEGGGAGGGMGMAGQTPMGGGGMGMMGQMPMGGGGMGMMGQTPMGGGMARMGHHGPAMGVGPGWIYGMGAGAPLSVDQVKMALEQRLASHGNPRLKLGTVRETDLGEILAEIVTRDGSLVQRLAIDRRTGHQRQVD